MGGGGRTGVAVGGDVALCAQTPWIENLSIRANIVGFGGGGGGG
jgi:hypothetical protein